MSSLLAAGSNFIGSKYFFKTRTIGIRKHDKRNQAQHKGRGKTLLFNSVSLVMKSLRRGIYDIIKTAY